TVLDGIRWWVQRDRLSFPLHGVEDQSRPWGPCITPASGGEELHLYGTQITYHPQSGWFEDTPLKGGTEEGCPLKGVHEGTFLIEAGHPAWNHSRASGLTVVLRLGLLYGLGSGAPPQDVLSSHATPERQSLFESHRQRRWLTRWSYQRPHRSMSLIPGACAISRERIAASPCVRLSRTPWVDVTPPTHTGPLPLL